MLACKRDEWFSRLVVAVKCPWDIPLKIPRGNHSNAVINFTLNRSRRNYRALICTAPWVHVGWAMTKHKQYLQQCLKHIHIAISHCLSMVIINTKISSTKDRTTSKKNGGQFYKKNHLSGRSSGSQVDLVFRKKNSEKVIPSSELMRSWNKVLYMTWKRKTFI